MSCQQTLIGNTMSNLTNGSLKHPFEKGNITRRRQRRRHKRKESYSDVCSVYQALGSLTRDHREHVNPNKLKIRLLFLPSLTVFWPSSCFILTRLASSPSNRWPEACFGDPELSFLSVCASQLRRLRVLRKLQFVRKLLLFFVDDAHIYLNNHCTPDV